MQFGFSPVQSQATFDAMLRQARLAESLGFNALWVHEHHSLGMLYPCPLMALTVLAGQTCRIALGTNVLLLPLYHPLRVAEDAAMVDVLSGGRLILGLGGGYAPDEFRAFGVSLSERGRRMQEGLRLIRAVWTHDPVTMHGALFHLEKFSLFPKPIQQPAPPLYVGAVAPAAIRRSAHLGDQFLIGATPSIDEIRERIVIYHQTLCELGQDPTQKAITLNRVVCVVKDQAAKEQAQRFFTERLLRSYDSWGHQDVTKLDDPSRLHEEVSRQRCIIGDASECIELIQQYADLGVRHIACLMNFGDPELAVVEESMHRFAEQVMPHCTGM
jgi:probable F420-dependent oxidoreductase